jgi:two-component system OmpR family sensor kinase
MRSIRRTLLLWLCVGLSGGIALAGSLLYFQAREEANEIFDYQMQQLAESLPSEPTGPISPGHKGSPDMERDIVIQMWDGTGLRIYHSHERIGLPDRAELGFTTVSTRQGQWRVYSTQLRNTVVQVAQPMSARRAVATEMALRTVSPLLVLFPFLGILVWLTINEGLAPVRRIAREVASRDAAALSPIGDKGMPEEIQPLTHALNDLLARLNQSIAAQRAFIADAAHELRTPLTALKLQIQLVERASSDEERTAALGELKQGFERATHLVQQLLTLARQEPGSAGKTRQEIDLETLARTVVAELAPVAQHRQIDLGIAASVPAKVQGDPDALRTMFGNIVENAIKYTPDGGTVDVTVSADGAPKFAVQDSGPGIPEDQLARVFDRFYRVPGTAVRGSGLGLAIAREVADAHGAKIALANTGLGLRAEISFPASSPSGKV